MKRLLVVVLLSSCGLPYVAERSYRPPPEPTTPIEVCWLETAGVQVTAGFGAAGHVQSKVWDATTSVLLIRHPKGDVLIDAGLAEKPEEDAKALSAWGRFIFSQTAARNRPRGSLKELLALAHAGPLHGVILSHAHADHAGGLGLLPGVPVWLAKEEASFAAAGSAAVMPAVAKLIAERKVEIPFADVPFADFEQSWDVYGDGTIVVVPTFGHTPGSVATFVNLGPRRLLHVGDLINLQESLDRQTTKSWLMRTLTDEDTDATDTQVARLVRLQHHDPTLWVLPAHDRSAYEAFFGKLPVDAHQPRCVNQ